MVDVSAKNVTLRRAVARSSVLLPPEIFSLLRDGEIAGVKGPVFQTAIVAGTMAVKRTPDLIPLCHPMAIESCRISIRPGEEHEDGGGSVRIECEVSVHHKTGVEMEALTGVCVAALTVYDMCKALSHDIRIVETRLVEKTGGKSDLRGEDHEATP